MPSELEGPTRISTGVPGLDDVLSGGLPPGHMFLLEGDPGTGKTTLGLQFIRTGAERGERVLYISLSETEAEIRTVAKSHAWSLDNVSIFEVTGAEVGMSAEEQYSAFHPSEIELFDTTQTILNRLEEMQPSRVVFDSLSEIRLLARDSLRYRRQVLALKHYFATRSSTVLLLDDNTSAQNERQLRSVAHGVIELQMMPRDFGRTRRRLQVAKLRGSNFREGYHDYIIETGGMKVFPRLISSEHREAAVDEVIGSGVEELDALWGAGLERGTSTLLIGPAGVGKSSLSMAYAVAAARGGHRAAGFLFDESVESNLRRCEGLGLNPRPLIKNGTLILEQVDPAELSPGEFVQRIRDSVEKRGVRIVIIDSLNGFLAAMPGERYVVLQLHELLSFLAQKSVNTFFVLSQSGVFNATMSVPVDLSYLADNMLYLRYFEAIGEVRKAISVVKKRSGEHESTIRELYLRPGSITVSPPVAAFHGVMTGTPQYLSPEIARRGRGKRRP